MTTTTTTKPNAKTATLIPHGHGLHPGPVPSPTSHCWAISSCSNRWASTGRA